VFADNAMNVLLGFEASMSGKFRLVLTSGAEKMS
jgi:hypothetical protein